MIISFLVTEMFPKKTTIIALMSSRIFVMFTCWVDGLITTNNSRDSVVSELPKQNLLGIFSLRCLNG